MGFRRSCAVSNGGDLSRGRSPYYITIATVFEAVGKEITGVFFRNEKRFFRLVATGARPHRFSA
ncbi:MAG TPA: hypothetical protein DEB39_14450 [Planctomycetaceae bacterium]|nr:hypothetical protein [Planctomycetaceae bacterium]